MTAKPVSRIEIAIIELHLRYERFQPELIEYLQLEVEDGLAHMKAYAKEKAEYLKENARLSQTKDGVMDSLKMVGECMMTFIAIATGFTMMYHGNPYIGVALVFLGVLELCNIIYKKTGLWGDLARKWSKGNEETEKKIKKYLPMAISAITMTGCMGGSYYASTLSASIYNNKQIFIITGLAYSTQGVAEIGGGVCGGRMLQNEGAYEELNTREALLKAMNEQFRNYIDNTFAEGKGSTELAVRTVRTITDISRRILSW